MNRPDIVHKIKEILHRVAPGAEVILYGSETRGDARPNSDIDILILVDKDHLSYNDITAITYPLYDLELTEQFLQMGIDELSVSPGRILPIRKIVRESECGCE